jgi:transposase, IS5 family
MVTKGWRSLSLLGRILAEQTRFLAELSWSNPVRCPAGWPRRCRATSIASRASTPRRCTATRKALHGNPYDGHTLGPVTADLEKLTGVAVCRIHGDKGYRGHNHPDWFKVWITGQVRRVTKPIRREMRRRAAIEPVIGHLKDDHRSAVLAAAGYNFSLLRRWFEQLLRTLWLIVGCAITAPRLA